MVSWEMICNVDTMKKIFIPFCAVLFFTCCTGELHQSEMSVSDDVTICAYTESSPKSRTIIDDSTLDISWTASDAINVFFGASESSRFVTSDSGDVAQFKGSVDVVTGGGEGLNDKTSLWGIYPYDENNTCDGENVCLTLPAVQPSAENTFAKGLFPQIARSQNFYMSFYNLCACFRFSVSSPDIKWVTLSGNFGEQIAGKVKVSMETVPVVEDILLGETELKMYAPEGESFKPGVHYYFVLFPMTFQEGLTITYYKENTYASYTYPNAYTLGRGKISRFADKDAGLTFVPIPLVDWEEGDHVSGEI